MNRWMSLFFGSFSFFPVLLLNVCRFDFFGRLRVVCFAIFFNLAQDFHGVDVSIVLFLHQFDLEIVRVDH